MKKFLNPDLVKQKSYVATFLMFLIFLASSKGQASNHLKLKPDNHNQDFAVTVLLHDPESELDIAFVKAINKYWTCSPIVFYSYQEKEKSILSDRFYLTLLEKTGDAESLDFSGIVLFRPRAASISITSPAPLYIRKDKNSDDYFIYFSSDAVAIAIANEKSLSGPDFYVAVMHQLFNQIFVKSNKSINIKGSNKTESGVDFFENISTDVLKDKTMHIDKTTAGYMLKVFKNEATLKKVVSKAAGLEAASIMIENADEITNSFVEGNKNDVFVFTYYTPDELNSIGKLWRAPMILDTDGKLLATLASYKKLMKMYGK